MDKPEEHKTASTSTTPQSTPKTKPEAEEVFIRKKDISTSGNPYKLATFLLAVLVFGLTAGVIYLEFFANRSFQKNEDCSEECTEYIYVEHEDRESSDSSTNNRDLIAEAKADRQVREVMQKLYNELKTYGTEKDPNTNSQYTAEIDKQYDTYFPVIYLKDHKTLTSLERAYNLKITAQNNTPIYSKLMNGGFSEKTAEILLANNFQKSDISYHGATAYRNDATKTTCLEFGSGNPFIVSCGYEGWIDTETIQLNSDLAQAYFDKTGRNLEEISANSSQIKDSGYESYQRLKTNAGGGFQLFYRTDTNDDWKYFAGGQSPLPCSDYNTDDLKRAFMGEPCYINATVNADTDTVKP